MEIFIDVSKKVSKEVSLPTPAEVSKKISLNDLSRCFTDFLILFSLSFLSLLEPSQNDIELPKQLQTVGNFNGPSWNIADYRGFYEPLRTFVDLCKPSLTVAECHDHLQTFAMPYCI